MKQSIVYVIAAAIVLAILISLHPQTTYSPKGILLPISAPAKAQVSADHVMLLPSWYQGTIKKMAYINLELHAERQSKYKQDQIINKAREMAAKFGANAILVQSLGYQPPSAQGAVLAMYEFHGIAVHAKGASL